ncbi:MAG: hypothetical protein H6937_05100 [Burkholderiales bacterium]|nr:hypothetical protein [Burkholderiales bacterium]
MEEQDIIVVSGAATGINQHFMVIKGILEDTGITRVGINTIGADMGITSAEVIIISEVVTDTSEVKFHTLAADTVEVVTEAAAIIDDS